MEHSLPKIREASMSWLVSYICIYCNLYTWNPINTPERYKKGSPIPTAIRTVGPCLLYLPLFCLLNASEKDKKTLCRDRQSELVRTAILYCHRYKKQEK